MVSDTGFRAAAVLCALLAFGGAQAREQPDPDLARVERLVIDMTNDFRRGERLEALSAHAGLEAAARQLAGHMARTGTFAHDADGKKPADRVRRQRYDYCFVAENIAYRRISRNLRASELAEDFVRGWIDSPGHRRNMAQPGMTDIGVAVARSPKTGAYYAVQVFGRPAADC